MNSVLESGLPIGAIYGLIAIGLAMIYRPMAFINMVHGEFVLLVAYVAYYIAEASDGNLAGVIGLPVVAGIAIASAANLLLFRPMRGRSHFYVLVVTIAAGVLVQELMRIFFDHGLPVSLPLAVRAALTPGLPGLGYAGIWFVGCGLVLAAAMQLWLARGWGGLALRAYADNPEVAVSYGVNTGGVERQAAAMAGLAAGVGGLGVVTLLRFVTPFIGVSLMFKGLAVGLVIGFGNMFALFIGGLLLGVGEAAVTIFVSTLYRDMITFTLIVVVLMVRPLGLVGASRVREV